MRPKNADFYITGGRAPVHNGSIRVGTHRESTERFRSKYMKVMKHIVWTFVGLILLFGVPADRAVSEYQQS